jgi:prevent-host-death family protein
MRIVGVRKAKDSFTSYLEQAQNDRIVITRHGQPIAVLSGVEGLDLEQVLAGMDDELWTAIEERRRHPRMMSLAEARRRLKHRRRGKKR